LAAFSCAGFYSFSPPPPRSWNNVSKVIPVFFWAGACHATVSLDSNSNYDTLLVQEFDKTHNSGFISASWGFGNFDHTFRLWFYSFLWNSGILACWILHGWVSQQSIRVWQTGGEGLWR
jgi:hypothetical protein